MFNNMRNLIYILISISSGFFSLNAQIIRDDNISRVEFYIQKGEMDSAKKYINLTLNQANYAQSPKAWFYKSYIYKELYKNHEKDNLSSPLRNESTIALKKTYTLEAIDSFIPQLESLIKFISSTYYNDIAKSLANFDFELAKINFENYKSLSELSVLLKEKIVENEIQFLFAYSTKLMIMNDETKLDSVQKKTLAAIYANILALDSNNAAANYNTSLLYYNAGVDIANNIDYDADFEELLATQDTIVKLFSQALPYMLKAYKANYKMEEVLEGLKFIFIGLNNLEKSAYYEEKRNNLNK